MPLSVRRSTSDFMLLVSFCSPKRLMHSDGRPSRVERRILHSPLTECIWINCHFSHSSLCVVPRATSNSLCLFAAKTCSCTLTGDHRAWSDAYCTPFLIYFSRTLSTQKILNSFIIHGNLAYFEEVHRYYRFNRIHVNKFSVCTPLSVRRSTSK